MNAKIGDGPSQIGPQHPLAYTRPRADSGLLGELWEFPFWAATSMRARTGGKLVSGWASLPYLLVSARAGYKSCQAGPSYHLAGSRSWLGMGLLRKLPSWTAAPTGEHERQGWGWVKSAAPIGIHVNLVWGWIGLSLTAGEPDDEI